jgi:hypothetical protein
VQQNLSTPAGFGSTGTSEDLSKISNFGYSSQSSSNTLGLLRTTELYADNSYSTPAGPSSYHSPQNDANQKKFRKLIRQLPPQTCMDILIQTFFNNVNWQYDLLDEEPFQKQLAAWGNVSYSDIQTGIDRLAPEMKVFPALLFQVLAQALLFHSPEDESINTLMVMPGMSFHELGMEYSDAGAKMLLLLGKREISIATVQAGLLRASFLKSSGKVVEAWHALKATICDAQEIRLHTGRPLLARLDMDENDSRDSHIDHRIWVVLHIWDIHMAVVLDRPIATDLKLADFAGTVENDQRRQEIFSHWKSETDPPRAFDVILAGYNVAYRYFTDIHQLEQNGTRVEDYSKVTSIHAAIKENLDMLPSWCQLENPSTKFDQALRCRWLPIAREGLFSLIHLVFLTLHRPYIFSMTNSRMEAIKAGIAILRAQEQLFQQLEPHQCKVFNPVYASFDAIVLIMAICLRFPDEERLGECLQVVQRGIQMLNAIGKFNSMARSAHAVVCSLYYRLKHRLQTLDRSGINSSSTELDSPNGEFIFSSGAPFGLSFDGIVPPRPIHDLFYDNLCLHQNLLNDLLDDSAFDPLTINAGDDWLFDGNFSDNSFWSFMNDLNH